MVIDDKRAKAKFGMIASGVVFLYDGDFYIKTEPITDKWGVCYAAIELVDGVPVSFNDDEMVMLVNVRMVIE